MQTFLYVSSVHNCIQDDVHKSQLALSPYGFWGL